MAAKNGHVEVFKYLLKMNKLGGVSLGVVFGEAARNGQIEITKHIIEVAPSINPEKAATNAA